MIEKRKTILVALIALVWASMATGLAAYYRLEQTKYQTQLGEKQKLIDGVASNYDASVVKRNLLSGDYGTLLGEYQWLVDDDYSSLMTKYEELLQNIDSNYTWALTEFPELNETYSSLFDKFEATKTQSSITKAEFGSLLDDFYKLFMTLSAKELDTFLGKIGSIKISLCIDYGNLTTQWHNVSVQSGATLFEATMEVADVEYSYWPTMGPGHVLIDSINTHKTGYWIWYYWNDASSEWVFGPVGCDAWILEDNGIYKWKCCS